MQFTSDFKLGARRHEIEPNLIPIHLCNRTERTFVMIIIVI